ncbi:MAG: hypothetical protein J6O09_01155 [Lachnospiraceae bacterium]|nr:hypothetical protein [Lachnospiraceae bacterium]
MNKLKKKYNASITVEAAFSFTITVFVLFLMLGPLLVIKTTSDVLIKLNDASKSRCHYEMIKASASNIYSEIKDRLDDKEIEKIVDAVNFSDVVLGLNNEYGENKSEYRNIDYVYNKNIEIFNDDTKEVLYDFIFGFTLPYNLYNIESVNKRLVSLRRAFVGSVGDRFSKTLDGGDYVYVANNHVNSSVYHLFIDCTYLVKRTEGVLYKDLDEKRNDANHKYSKCNYCFKNINMTDSTTCYITEYGDKYHYKSDCPLMTAYITKILKEKIDMYNLNLCSRCSKRENK